MKHFRTRPSPALVVSVVALAFAVAGSAFAGVATISALSKKEKKQVRKVARKVANKRIKARTAKIANRRITARAPNLSVKSAESAASAGIASGVAGEYYAVVNPDGSLARGTANVTSNRAGLGQYYVFIDRNAAGCFSVASLGGTPTAVTNGQIAALFDSGGPANAIFVVTRNAAGTSTEDRTFTVHIRC